jgi:hypothetical protein
MAVNVMPQLGCGIRFAVCIENLRDQKTFAMKRKYSKGNRVSLSNIFASWQTFFDHGGFRCRHDGQPIFAVFTMTVSLTITTIQINKRRP